MMVKKHALFLICLSMTAFMGCDSYHKELTSCTLNEKNCADSIFYFCPDGKEWVQQPCPDGCNDTLDGCRVKAGAECAIDACDANNASIIKKCIDGHYVPQNCPSEKPICHGMACIESNVECAEGSSMCDGENMLKTCGSDGKWHTEQCPGEKPLCRDGETACSAYNACGTVAHNALICDENKVKKCNDGDLAVTDDCTAKTPAQVCDNETRSCIGLTGVDCLLPTVIKDGEAVCMNDADAPKLFTCSAGTATSKDCTTDIENAIAACDPADHTRCAWKCADGYIKTEDGKACKEGTATCAVDVCDDSNANNAVLKKCNSGMLSEPNACSALINAANADAIGCNTAKNACIIKTCKAGYAPNTAGTACEPAAASSCDDSGKSYLDGSYFCKNDTQPAMCKAGVITDLKACNANEKCNTATINTTHQCESDKTQNKCSESELAICKSNKYIACAIVEGEALCYDDPCTQEGNQKYTCQDDEYGIYSSSEECVKTDDGSLILYVDYNDCSSLKCTESTGQCVKSVSDEFEACEDNYPDRCENNYAVYCDKDYGVVAAASCSTNTCLTIDGLADCFAESDKCTELNATQKICVEDNDGYGYDVTLTCKKASDNNTYWTITAYQNCPNKECNALGNACAGTSTEKPADVPDTCIKGTSSAVCGSDGNAWFCGTEGYYLNAKGSCTTTKKCIVCDNGYGGCTDKTKEEFCKTESGTSTEKPANVPDTCTKGTSPAVCGSDGNAWFCGNDGKYYLNATGTCSGSNKCLVCDNGYGGCTDKTKEEFCKPYDGEVLKACTATSTDKCIGACSADKQTGYYWNNGLKTVDCSANSDCTASDTGYVRCGDATPTD